MTAENTLQWMMDFYSDLFPTRQRCLDHLFCTIGNGYEWVNGELVCEDFLSKRYVMIEQIEQAKAWHEDLYEQHRKIELELAKKHPNHKPNPKYFHHWYPLCKEYSFLYNYPADIKPDWLKLLNECKELLIADGIEI